MPSKLGGTRPRGKEKPPSIEDIFHAGWDAHTDETKRPDPPAPGTVLECLDYVFVREEDGRYRVEHSYYRTGGKTYYTAEEAMRDLETCANFGLYAVVTFSPTVTLPRRRK